MGKRIVIALVLLLWAVPAVATDAWDITDRILSSRTGIASVATYTPTTTTGDTESPTLDTSQCSNGITFTAFGALTGLAQLCNAITAWDAGLDTDICQDINLSSVNGAGTHSVQIIPAPAWFRIVSITNSDSTDKFMVTCTGADQ